jgi:hypothetical protein
VIAARGDRHEDMLRIREVGTGKHQTESGDRREGYELDEGRCPMIPREGGEMRGEMISNGVETWWRIGKGVH